MSSGATGTMSTAVPPCAQNRRAARISSVSAALSRSTRQWMSGPSTTGGGAPGRVNG